MIFTNQISMINIVLNVIILKFNKKLPIYDIVGRIK
jgi:hypothetical protein